MRLEEDRVRLSIDANKRLKEKKYWLQKLSGDLVKSVFPYDRKSTGPDNHSFQSIPFEITAEGYEQVMKLSNKSDLRLHIILTAVLVGILYRYTGNRDIIIGAPIINQQIKGDFINTVMILRNQLRPALSFKDLLLNVSRVTSEAHEHVNYPMNTLLYQLNLPAGDGDFPLFDVALLLKNIHDKENIQHLNLNMIFSFFRTEESIEGEVEFNSLKYHPSTIEQIISHYKRFMAAALADINTSVEAIEILEEKEKQQLLFDFNPGGTRYPRDKTIHQLFEEQVGRTPDNTALLGGNPKSQIPNSKHNASLTYKELNEKSYQLAQILIEKGVKPDTIVGIMVERSIEMIVGILAILKAGGAYLPIDPDYPQDRINYMLKDSGAKILLTASEVPGLYSPQAFKICPKGANSINNYQLTINNSQLKGNSLAYVIYTSGTTGTPKGSLIQHRNLVSLMIHDDYLFDFDSNDVWTMFHSYCFDFSVWEMYGALLYGGKLVLISKMTARDPRQYLQILRTEKVTVLNQTPSAFCHLLNEELKSREIKLKIKYVIFGGEALNPVILKEWKIKYPGTRLINMYGITETTVHVTYKEISDREIEVNSSSIGTPIPTLGVYILDQAHRLLPIGVTGEICVGGEGVGRGYLNRPVLTKEKFLRNPYKPGEIFYRSGDLGRVSENGDIEYIGRMDNQVKIRGHRVELGELENQLLKFSPVIDAAVVAREDKNGEKQLAAYVIPNPDCCFTISRLLKLEKQGQLKNHQYYELPNGLTIFYLNRTETDFMYREIVEKSSYTNGGITLEKDACIFDVGANIGIFSLFVKNMCKKAKIFAFEPVPPIFEVLRLNASIYDNQGDIKLFQYGFSSSEGEADFTYYPNATVLSGQFADEQEEMKNVEAFMRNQPSSRQEDTDILEAQLSDLLKERLVTNHFSCQLKTVSQVIRENEIEKIDLLKIDVEKSEINVLEGINETDWAKIQQIAIEVHNIDGRLQTLVEMLKRRGYDVVFEQDNELEDTDLYNIYARMPKVDSKNSYESDGLLPCRDDLSDIPGENRSWTSPGCLVKDIRNYLKDRLPDYMIPDSIILLERLPITFNGKMDRKALLELEVKRGVQYNAPQTSAENKLVEIWADVLNIDKNVISRDSNFFDDLGGHSLKAVQLVSKLIKDTDVTITKIFEYPTIETLAENISFKKDNLKEIFENIKESVNEMSNEDPLESFLKEEYDTYKKKISQEEVFTPKIKNYKRILLTGATGYLGAYLTFEFMNSTDATLFLLVRGSTEEDAENRLKANLVFYFGEDFYERSKHKLVILKGDLRMDRLGIGSINYRKLSEEIDAIVHAAANVTHFGKYETLFKDNVEGTENLLQFAILGKQKDFHYISTISIGQYTDEADESEYALFTEYTNKEALNFGDRVYLRSKLEAEKKVLSYMKKGLNASIYRVGNLCFHSKTGKFQKNIETNAFYARIRAYISLGVIPDVEYYSLGHISFIDYLAKAVALIITNVQLRNETFHIYNDLDMYINDLANSLKKLDINIKIVSIEEFLDFLEASLEDENRRVLIERLLLHSGIFEQLLPRGRRTRGIVVKDKTDMLLKKLGFEWHTLEVKHIKRMIMHCKEVGFLN